MDRLPGYETLLSRIEHKKAQVKSQLPTEHAHLVDEFAVYVLEQVNTCLNVPATVAQDDGNIGSNGTVTRSLTSDIQIDNELTNHTSAPTTVDNQNREGTSGSISGEQTVHPLPPPLPITHSTTIQANIKVEDVSNGQLVQHFKCVKKEEEDGGEYVMECDCEDCETCRVKMEIKEELDESGETEMGGNCVQAIQGNIRVKKEEEDGDGEGERPNKILRMNRVVGNVPVGSPALNIIFTNVEYIDDQMATSSTNSFTIEDHTQPSQPVTIPLPTPIVTPTQSSSSTQLVNEPLRDELINGDPRMDNEAEVLSDEFDQKQVDEDNSTLNRVHNIEQDDDEEGDETIEQREDASAADERQVPAESFVKRIEPADELGNRFECDYRGCGRRMKHRSNLIIHIRTHTGEKPFKCSMAGCDRAFGQKGELKVHLNVHSGSRPFVCSWPECEARFAKKGNLTLHTRSHSDERPFECDQCDATFTYHSHLVDHRRTHTGVRPFICTWPDCGQTFTRSSILKTHSHVHSNERQFVCEVTGCTKIYKRKDALRRHQKDNHN